MNAIQNILGLLYQINEVHKHLGFEIKIIKIFRLNYRFLNSQKHCLETSDARYIKLSNESRKTEMPILLLLYFCSYDSQFVDLVNGDKFHYTISTNINLVEWRVYSISHSLYSLNICVQGLDLLLSQLATSLFVGPPIN